MQLIKAFNQAVNTRETDPGLNRAKSSTADARTAEAGLGSTEPRRVRLRSHATRAVCGFLATAALLTLPLPAQAQIAVWSSTLTVRDLGNNVLGCGIHIANGRCSAYLGNDTFTHYSRTYEFVIISLHPNGDLVTSFNQNLANNTRDLRLNVDGRAFAFENADNPNRSAGCSSVEAPSSTPIGDTAKASISTSSSRNAATSPIYTRDDASTSPRPDAILAIF